MVTLSRTQKREEDVLPGSYQDITEAKNTSATAVAPV